MVQLEGEVQHIKTHTLIEIFLYGIFLATSIYYITNENFGEVFEKFEPSQFILKNTTKHITFIPHAVTKLASYSLFIPSIIISILTYLLMRLFIREFLKFWRKTNEKKEELSRIITLNEQKEKFESTNIKNNYLSSTYFIGSSFKVTILSFFYGGLVYLSQRIQVWCLAISFTQLYHFNTGKSFWPLLIFTLIIAIQAAYSEYRKWHNDAFINSRMVKTNRGEIQRGEILSGDIIYLRNNNESPCDLVVLSAKKEKSSKRKRIIFSMNEAQVTGETAPVRKFVPLENNEKLTKIEVSNLEFHKGCIFVKDESNNTLQKDFNEKNVIFGNSLLVCEDDVEIKGIATWLSTETKALTPPKSTEDLRQPSPFSDYTIKGFLLTVTLMVSISLINTIIALMKHNSELKVSYFTVWINNLMYLNMMVPQAMEQVRMAVCTVFSFHFRKGINVNNSLVSDILGSVTRIVSDKTGTLTKNKMEPFLSMVFPNEKEFQILTENSMNQDQKKSSIIFSQALAILATTGKQPEEMALQKYLAQYAKIIDYDVQEPNETERGEIIFKLFDGKEHKMIVHVNFGLNFTYLVKSMLFEHNGDFYVAIQAGGEELWTEKYWKGKIGDSWGKFLKKESIEKSELWFKEVKNLPSYSGSPRIWGHGLKKISSSEAHNIINAWKQANLEDNNTEKLNKITLQAIERMEFISQTLMIDSYREGVLEGIKELVSNGKQMSICTGDSENASKMIARQIQLPSNHIFLKETEEELMNQLDELMNKKISQTIFVNQSVMKLLENTEKHHGFEAPIFQKLLSLFEEKLDEKFLHYPIFCRATPSLKPFCVKMMQYKKPGSLYDSFFSKRNYVLAIGDGSNDLNMFHQADVSLGIESGETKDIVSKASFSLSHEWQSTVSLLLKEGPEKSSLIALMVKLVFLKHWMTAFTLLFDLIYVGYTLMPLDPIDPLMMMIFNAIIFTQITSHTSIDHPPEEVYQKKDTMTFKSFLRWVLAAGLTGFAIDWIVRWLFPHANAKEFGSMILIAKSISISIYLVLITNEWSSHHQNSSSLSKQLTISVTSILLSSLCLFSLFKHESISNIYFKGFLIILSIIFIISSFVPIFNLMRMKFIFDSQFNNFIGRFEMVMPRFLHWSHTWNGRILPIYLFILLVKLNSGISLIIFIVIIILTSIVTYIIFLFCISKIGFLRALFEGKMIAVATISFVLGYLIGRFQ